MAGAYQMNFNQDFTSISVLSDKSVRLFTINNNETVDEIFAKEEEQIRLVERLFNSSLIVLVTEQKPNYLKMLHYKKKQEICSVLYPSEILSVRMNRHRLVACLAESIHIHDTRDMKIIQSIENIATNHLGLFSLSMNSYLAYPICTTNGELRIFNAYKLKTCLTIKAHDSKLSALSFSSNGSVLATASERGTVIRIFCVKNGQRIQEFRRGVKRCVRIASLVFATTGDFLCASSNTETVHIFKIDLKAVEALEQKTLVVADNKEKQQQAETKKNSKSTDDIKKEEEELEAQTTWSGYLTKAVSSYLIPTQVTEVFSQDRAFATALLPEPGLKHVCCLARIQKELRLLMACADGFLYMHEFDVEKGGPCKLLHVHDLRYALEGVIELTLTESMDNLTFSNMQAQDDDCDVQKTKCSANSVIVVNPAPVNDNSYASILRGKNTAANKLTAESAKCRKLCDAIDTPTRLFDDKQFPPVAIAAKD